MLCRARVRSSAWLGWARFRSSMRVEREVVELVLVGLGLGDGHRLSPLQALVTLAGDGPELGVVVVAGELDQVLLAVDVDLGDDGLQVVGLLDGRVAVQAPGRRARTGCVVVALPSLISSSVVNRIGSVGAAGSAARIAGERSRPTSGWASLWSDCKRASAWSGSMPVRPSSVGIRSAWLVGMSSSRAPPGSSGLETMNGTWIASS